MIIDLEKFIANGQKYWERLDDFLNKLDDGSIEKLTFVEVKELQYLYQKCSASLSQHTLRDFELGKEHGLEPFNVMNHDATMNKERFERRRHAAELIQHFAELRIPGLVLDDDRAGHHIGVAVEELRHAVHHDIRAEPERSLQQRRGEGVVDDVDRRDENDGSVILPRSRPTGNRCD